MEVQEDDMEVQEEAVMWNIAMVSWDGPTHLPG